MSEANVENLSDLKPGDKISANVAVASEGVYAPPPDKPNSTATKQSAVAIACTVIMISLSMLAGKATRQICVVLETPAEDHVEIAYTGILGGAQTFPADTLDESI
jgi:hypothetical protein